MPWKGHVRFGGRSAETGRWQRRYRAAARPYQALWTRFRQFGNYRLRVLLFAGGVEWPHRPRSPAIRPPLPSQM